MGGISQPFTDFIGLAPNREGLDGLTGERRISALSAAPQTPARPCGPEISLIIDQSNLPACARFMFDGASSFNQPLDAWRVDNLVTMDAMFWGASSFDQVLGWCMPNGFTTNQAFTNTRCQDTWIFRRQGGRVERDAVRGRHLHRDRGTVGVPARHARLHRLARRRVCGEAL